LKVYFVQNTQAIVRQNSKLCDGDETDIYSRIKSLI